MQKRNIANLKPYTSARDLYKKGIFLDANENYQQWVKVDWFKAINLNRYPDSSADELRQKIVKYYVKDFKKENIFVGRGSDEIIDLLIKGFVENDEFIMMMNPSYSVYQVQADINNVGCKKILLQPNFSLDLEAIKNSLSKVKIIFLCSPNNPTGSLVKEEEITELLKSFSGLLVVDEAYIEYAGIENSLSKLVKESEKVVVLRTFSKAWGLAGIRLGYVIAQSSIIETLLKIKDSYNISSLSQLVGLQALRQVDQLREKVRETMRLKNQVEKQLNKLGYKTISNKANFILLRIKNAKEVYKKLAQEGIVVRDRSNLPFLNNVLRITVGSENENSQLISLISNMSPQRQNKPTFDSVIFDMDGVLIDVSKSYRKTIQKTVNILLERANVKRKASQKQIEVVKDIAGFNNDWDVTFALYKAIRDKQQLKSLKPPTKRQRETKLYREAKLLFQNIYLGNKLFKQIEKQPAPLPNEAGFINNENPLIKKSTLTKLRDIGLKLSIATGRPRKEAQWAIKSAKLKTFFPSQSVVALEDTNKEKPNPAPLLKAKMRIKSKTPVYIGDSINDTQAAKAASMPCIFVGKGKLGDTQIKNVNQVNEVLV